MTGKSISLLVVLLLACGPDERGADDRCSGGLLCPCVVDDDCDAVFGTEAICFRPYSTSSAEGMCTHVCTAIPCATDEIELVTCGPLTDATDSGVGAQRVCMLPCDPGSTAEQYDVACDPLEGATCSSVSPPALPVGSDALVCGY